MTRSTPAQYPLRLPRGLHERLKQRAADEGVSLNALMTTLLAGAVAYSLSDHAES
jgi:predicted HicB family RNase H-like nuclease